MYDNPARKSGWYWIRCTDSTLPYPAYWNDGKDPDNGDLCKGWWTDTDRRIRPVEFIAAHETPIACPDNF